LVYDPERNEVSRDGRIIRLMGEEQTGKVLGYLIRKGRETTPTRELHEFWEDIDTSPETIEKRVRMVNRFIKPLGMKARKIRKIGWFLEALPGPESQSAPEAPGSGPKCPA
jgi:hypothetical protein